MSRKKLDSRAIIMLVFGLLAVIAIMIQMRKSLPTPPAELKQLGNARIGIVDSTYINLPFRFSLKRPNRFWRMEILSQDTVLAPLDEKQNVNDQIVWLVRLSRHVQKDTAEQQLQSPGETYEQYVKQDALSAVARIGVLATRLGYDSQELALTILADMIARYEANGGRVRILQQVASPAHHTLKGNYFVVILPDDAEEVLPVRVVTILPRGEFFYCQHIATTEIAYPHLRDEIEELVQRFLPLPSTFK